MFSSWPIVSVFRRQLWIAPKIRNVTHKPESRGADVLSSCLSGTVLWGRGNYRPMLFLLTSEDMAERFLSAGKTIQAANTGECRAAPGRLSYRQIAGRPRRKLVRQKTRMER